jgi:hypothetical protein
LIYIRLTCNANAAGHQKKYFLLGNQNIDNTLIVSETSLASIPRYKFHINSWYLGDDFMIYGTDVFTITVANLIKSGYIRITKENVKTYKAFGIAIWTNADYLIQLSKRPHDSYLIGWLEEKILEQFKYSNLNNLDLIIYDVLNEMFEGNHNLTNPGKCFVLEILKHQRINLFKFKHKKSWISNSVALWYNENSINQVKPRVFKVGDFNLAEIEISMLRKIINAQFKKFQNLD